MYDKLTNGETVNHTYM